MLAPGTSSAFFFETPRTRELAVKLVLVGCMIVTSGLHDWWIGPEAATLVQQDDESASRWQKVAAVLGALTALLVVGIAVYAVALARPWLTLA